MAAKLLSLKQKQQRIKRMEALVAKAIEALDAPGHTYTDFIHALIELGEFVHEVSNNNEIELQDTDFPKGSVTIHGAVRSDELIKNKKSFAAAFLSKIYSLPLDKQNKRQFKFLLPTDKLQIIHNGLAFRAFEAAWEDDALRDKSERQLAVKADMNRSLRQKINMGFSVLANCTHMEFVQELNVETAAKRNKEATDAIKNYKTRWQKALSVIGWIFTVAVALTFGITTGAAIVLTFGTALPWIAAAIAVGIAGSVTNGIIFLNPVYNLLNGMFGKDKYFEGLTHHVDENGVKQQLSTGKRLR